MSANIFGKVKPSYYQTIIINTLVLFLVGIYFFLTLHAGNISQIFTENINTVVEFNNDYSSNDREAVEDFLRTKEGVLTNSIEFVDKTEALEIMKEELDNLFFVNEENNPFFSLIRFNVASKFHSKSYFNELQTQLVEFKGVNNVYIQESFFNDIRKKLISFGFYALIVALLLMAFAISIIYNTIHLALQSDKEEITTMKLVGADWFFIKKPYLKQSFKIGILASGFASIMLILTISLLHFQFLSLSGIVSPFRMILVVLILFVFSTVFSLISTNLILNKFLYSKKSF